MLLELILGDVIIGTALNLYADYKYGTDEPIPEPEEVTSEDKSD